MKKGKKIKRYSRKKSFSPRASRSPWRILLSVAVVVALVFVGISAYRPVMDFFQGRTKPTPKLESSAPEVVVSTPEPLPPEPIVVPEPEPEPPVVLGASVSAKLLPLATAQDPAALAVFIEELPANYNAVVFETKNSLGEITYQSTNPQAIAWEAVIGNPVDLSALTQALKEKELHLVAKMAAFSDPIAARGDIDNNAVMHSSGVIWIDNTLAAGGKPWTTPYSTTVKDYNVALAQEMKDLGAEMILLDYVRFPNDPTSSARFGGDGSQTPAAALSSFVEGIKTATEVTTAVTVPYGATYAGEASNTRFFGADPLTLFADTIAFDMLDEEFLQNGVVHPYVLEVAARAKETSAYVVFILRPAQLPAGELGQSFILYG